MLKDCNPKLHLPRLAGAAEDEQFIKQTSELATAEKAYGSKILVIILVIPFVRIWDSGLGV